MEECKLSRKDIESFGFEFDATRSKVNGNFVGSYLNDVYYLDYSPYNYRGEFNNSVSLRIIKIKDLIEDNEFKLSIKNYDVIYDDIIKNKNELEDVLRKLNIINDTN